MEPTKAALRYKVILGKFPVTKLIEHGTFLEFYIQFPGGIVLGVNGPKADVREGDLLTLYTEILAGAKH